MINGALPAIVSTDLDGTLLDHYSYSWAAAEPSLDLLKQRGVPVIINTSKTRDEVVSLQTDLNNHEPFIVENGSAIYFPKASFPSLESDLDDKFFQVKLLGSVRQNIIETLKQLRKTGFAFESYSDWTVEDLIEKTGLSKEKAEQSQRRLFSEPLIWQDSPEKLDAFKEKIEQHHLRLIKGGRFYHVLGNSNKGKAITTLKNILYPSQDCSLICLGDSYNDLDMLGVANVAVLCRSPAHDFPEHELSNHLICTDEFGPRGWNEAISQLFHFQEA